MSDKIRTGDTYSSRPERRYVKRAKESASGKDIDKGFEDVNEKIDNVISGVYKYKGSVSSYADLPTEGLEVGYTYNVNDSGKNYAWNGTEWDDIGGIGKIVVANITALSQTQCENLQCGDIVIKQTGTQFHSYRVSYKEHHVGMCLTYSDASCLETVSYDYVGETWTYNSRDVQSFSGLVPVVANPTLVGDETILNGIEINGVKYKAGGGAYLHRFNYDEDANSKHYAIFILNTSSEPINTFDKFYENINKIVHMTYITTNPNSCTSMFLGTSFLQDIRVLLYIYGAYNSREFLAIYKDDQTGLKISNFTETITAL